MIKLEILERCAHGWSEFYLNGLLIFEGDSSIPARKLLIKFLDELQDNEEYGIMTEFRYYLIPYEYDLELEDEYDAPLHSLTGENYWVDWVGAKTIERNNKRGD